MINFPGERKTAIPQEELLDLVNLVLPDDNSFILKNRQLEKFYHHINILYQNIKFTMGEESNKELEFLDILLKHNNDNVISLY